MHAWTWHLQHERRALCNFFSVASPRAVRTKFAIIHAAKHLAYILLEIEAVAIEFTACILTLWKQPALDCYGDTFENQDALSSWETQLL